MKAKNSVIKVLLLLLLLCALIPGFAMQRETAAEHDSRMQWWRDARFGMFIHWGLYSIPAGEWKGSTRHAEWIRTSAEIPIAEYEKFVGQFNPVKFNADEWVKTAKAAGMKYIVITTKHHDGFGLFDSRYTDFDVMSTPFKRDIMKELAEACRKNGIKMCWYHSIMDWHHPDYLPRRDWEKDRPVEGANFDRYVQYMKNEIKELLTNYGDIGVLWFDGEWESTWNQDRGRDLYSYVRGLQPKILVNNRVGAGRSGMEGFTKAGEFGGDFGTPEQQVPATGLPGVDWESCITMNGNWGYNSHDNNWKSSKALIQMLVDVASKGGNLLLNVGPTSEGLFPQPSIDRLRDIGNWMNVNSEAVYGTQASPFRKLDWGRCTRKQTPTGTRLYLHVFSWPADGKLVVPGILNDPKVAYLLADNAKAALPVSRQDDAIVIGVKPAAPDPDDSVIVLELTGKADVNDAPAIESDFDTFVNNIDVALTSERDNVQIRYTLDGSAPDAKASVAKGKITLTASAMVSARCFRNDRPVSGTVAREFKKVVPLSGDKSDVRRNGVHYAYYEGDWNSIPDFKTLTTVQQGAVPGFQLSPRRQPERMGFEFTGFIKIPADDVYAFYTESDDGSRLYIDDALVVDNDGLHGSQEKRGTIALGTGMHRIRVTYFNKTGSLGLNVYYAGSKTGKQAIPAGMLFY